MIARSAGWRVLVVALTCWMLAACSDSVLYASLPEQQANEVEAALLGSGVSASKRAAEDAGRWAIHVPADQTPSAMAVLHARGLPREPSRSMGEVFRKEGFVSSPLEERARYIAALSTELSQTLMQIDGVVLARVHIALPESSAMVKERDSATASVVIIQKPAAELQARETDIKAIITDGVEGLDDVNRVTVKFFTRRAHAPEAPAGEGGSQTTAAASSPGWPGLLVMIGSLAYWSRARRRPADAVAGGAAR